MAGNYYAIAVWPGHERNLMGPDFAANCGDGIAEGGDCFRVPSGRSGFELSRFGEIVGPERNERKQAEQRRSGSKDCLVRPLALGFDAEVSTRFLERDFDLPAADEPGEDVLRTGIEIGCEEGLRLELSCWIAHEHPTDRHRRG